MEIYLETWPIEQGKGIDDVFRNGHRPQLLTGEAVQLKLDADIASTEVLADAKRVEGSAKGTEASSSGESAKDVREFSWLSSAEFANTQYEQRYIVENVLVAGQPCIVGGRSKTLKTSLLIDLALSIGTGTPFLGEFPTRLSTVTLLSGESGAFTIQETARRVAYQKNINLAEAAVSWGFELPQVANDSDLVGIYEAAKKHYSKVIIIDPAYLCLLGGSNVQASNVFEMGPLLLKLSELGTATNSTIILCHHCKKFSENPNDPPELEDLSMAGFAEWARQWLLTGRREPYSQGSGEHKLWLNIGGSAGHSGCYAVDVNEGRMDDRFQGRRWNVGVRTVADVRQEKADRKAEWKERQAEATAQEQEQRVLACLARFPSGETRKHIRESIGMRNDVFNKTVERLFEQNKLEECSIEKEKKTYPGLKLVSGNSGVTSGDVRLHTDNVTAGTRLLPLTGG
jgi:AAA domain